MDAKRLIEDEFHKDEFGDQADEYRRRSQKSRQYPPAPPVETFENDGDLADHILELAERCSGSASRVKSEPSIRRGLKIAERALEVVYEQLTGEI